MVIIVHFGGKNQEAKKWIGLWHGGFHLESTKAHKKSPRNEEVFFTYDWLKHQSQKELFDIFNEYVVGQDQRNVLFEAA